VEELFLPGAERAVITEAKLRDYALSSEHPEGRHKARVFASALGIGRDDWEYLREEIAMKLPAARVSAVRESAYGFLYEVPMLVEGLNGATAEVITAWFLKKESDVPRLVSTYVNTP
jgi:hypothetical protein